MKSSSTHEAMPVVIPMRAPARLLQRKCACGNHSIAGGDCDSCQKEQTPTKLQRAAVNAESVAEVPPVVQDVLRSSGQPLDTETRAFMEQRFGHDFSQVRVHTDARAAESARAVNALAYTVGRDVVFGAGQHAPQTEAGRRLLAHELAHTIQQSGSPAQPGGELLIGAHNSVFEREADTAAEGLSTGAHLAPMTPSVSRLQKNGPSTPEDFAEKALKAGPKTKTEKATFEKAGKDVAAAEKAGKKITRVEIPAGGKDEGVKGVTSPTFASEFKKCPSAKSEGGLPKAFLCAISDIATPNVAPDDAAAIDTNVRVAFKASKSGGSIWVVSASLPWVLNTTGYLDIDAIDSKMLAPYETHEKGHRTIASQIRDRLSKLMQAELERVLPTDKKPLDKTGKTWDQDGVDAIVKQVSEIRDRYMKWFDDFADAADKGWDAQEKSALSKIAAAIKAKERKPGSSVPEVP